MCGDIIFFTFRACAVQSHMPDVVVVLKVEVKAADGWIPGHVTKVHHSDKSSSHRVYGHDLIK